MKIKVLTSNADGNFVFSKEELEKLLNEAYNEGYQDGKASQHLYSNSPILNIPSIPLQNIRDDFYYTGTTATTGDQRSC